MKKKHGFTLVEMLIVIVIIGILAAALIPRLGSARGRANDTARKANLQQIAQALVAYSIDKGKYPFGACSLDDDDLVQALNDAGMSNIPKDPAGNWPILSDIIGSNALGGQFVCGSAASLTTGQYLYSSLKKDGSYAKGFALIAATETEGGSNWVYCPVTSLPIRSYGSSATNVDDVNLQTCTSITATGAGGCQGTTGGNTTCYYDKTASPSQLRYLYKY